MLKRRVGFATCLAALLALAAPAAASASTTIGQLAPGAPPAVACVSGPADVFQRTLTAGNSYVVPPEGAAITSWSTNAASPVGQMFTMKVFRLVSGVRYQVVGHDGPRPLTPSKVNTFTTSLPVQPGDIVGVNDVNASTVNNACLFDTSSPTDTWFSAGGDLADGGQNDFFVNDSLRVNLTAVVAFVPSNQFSFGSLKRNTSKGIATLSVVVPGSGTVSLSGKGVKAQRTGGATLSKAVSAAGTVKLRIKAKGSKNRTLEDRGKVKVRVKVTFTPNGVSSGDVPGARNTETKRVKLIKKD